MRVLLLGEYSNVHYTLALGLRKLGHSVTLVSNGDFWKNYPRDIDVSRKSGKLGGIRLYLKILALLPRLRGYDVVQLINPMFFELKAERLLPIYHYLRKHNKCIILGAYGMDYYYTYQCSYKKPLPYSDFNIGNEMRRDPVAEKGRADWIRTAKERLNKEICHTCNGIVAGLFEYWVCYKEEVQEKLAYIPFPIIPKTSIDQDALLKQPSKLKIFIGISKNRSAYKGTDVLLKELEEVHKQWPDKFDIIKVEGLSFDKYIKKMAGSDIIIDQLYGLQPAMNGLEAMSRGLIYGGGNDERAYGMLGNTMNLPIIHLTPDYKNNLKQIEYIIHHPEEIPQMKVESIQLISKYHDYIKVAKQYEEFYLSRMPRNI